MPLFSQAGLESPRDDSPEPEQGTVYQFYEADAEVNESQESLPGHLETRRVLRTPNFVIYVESLTTVNQFLHTASIAPNPVVSSDSKSLFRISIHHRQNPDRVVWQTAAGVPFIRAAVGNDSLTPGNGEYRIIQNNQFVTTHQTLAYSGEIHNARSLANLHSPEIDVIDAHKFVGQLMYQEQKKRRNPRQFSIFDLLEPQPVLNYTFTIVEKESDRLDFEIEVVDAQQGDGGIKGYDRIILTAFRDHDEDIFGFGEQFSYWNMNGLRVPVITREQGIGRGRQPITYILNHLPPRNPAYAGGDTLSTYTAIGHYISSKQNSLFLHNSELAFFDFTVLNRTNVEICSRHITLSVFYAERPLDLIQSYTKHVSGTMKRLPDWATGSEGAIVGVQGGSEKVIRVVETLQNWGVKVAGVWLQDWVGTKVQPLDFSLPIPLNVPGFPGRNASVTVRFTSAQMRLWWNWEHDREKYPNWAEFTQNLRENYGVKVLAYINPFLTDVESGKKPESSYSNNYFREASDKGYLVKRWILDATDDTWSLQDYLITSGPGVFAGMVDVTNPEAREWYKGLIKKNMIEQGVMGWMADFGEYMPFDGVIYLNRNEPPPVNGKNMNRTASKFHNLYPLEWAKLNEEAVEESGVKEIALFSRSASPETPKHCASFWQGDQLHTWDHLDGLESSIMSQISSSLSGMAYSHSDVGGYTTLNVDPTVILNVGERRNAVKLPILERRARFVRQDSELFERWMEVSALLSTAMYRTHEGSAPAENLQVWDDEDLAKQFGHFYEMFASLQGYKKLLSDEHEAFGYSPVRPMFLHFPRGGTPVWSMERLQYMMGPMLMIVPIASPGVRRLNEKIADIPLDDDDPEEQTDQILKSIRRQMNQEAGYSSDEEEEDDRPHPPPVRRQMKFISWKSSYVSGVRTWARRSLMRASQLMINLTDMAFGESGEKVHLDNENFPKYKTYTKENRQIVAPPELPKPLHGRPYLPQGVWKHVISKTVFRVTQPEGLYITDAIAKAGISCEPGKPPVFIRVLTKESMHQLIRAGMNGAPSIEDWKYWVDGKTDDGIDAAAERAWKKYTTMKDSLKPFLQFLEAKSYPKRDAAARKAEKEAAKLKAEDVANLSEKIIST